MRENRDVLGEMRLTAFRCSVCDCDTDKWGPCPFCGRSGTLESHKDGQQSLESFP